VKGGVRGSAARVLREPLLHFLVAGALLYFAHGWLHRGADEAASGSAIVVNRARLLEHLQYRAKAFQPGLFDAYLAGLSPQARQALVDEVAEEETLFREATALGLGQGDYVIRQRMIQKLLFLLDDAAATAADPPEEELAAWFTAHKAEYIAAPSYTFTHVFFDAQTRGGAGAKATAEDMLQTLRRHHVPFADAGRYGDRFPYLLNYVERTPEFLASQFGPDFARTLGQLVADAARWQGPFQSALGWHLVLLTQREPARELALVAVRGRVVEDYRRERVEAARRRAIAKLIAAQTVRVELP
jgi:hypothetical protein